MAEGFLRKYAPKFDVISAGTQPTSQTNPTVVQVMMEIGNLYCLLYRSDFLYGIKRQKQIGKQENDGSAFQGAVEGFQSDIHISRPPGWLKSEQIADQTQDMPASFAGWNM